MQLITRTVLLQSTSAASQKFTLQVLAAASENVWKDLADAGKTASLVKYLPHIHEDPSSIKSTHVKRRGYHPRVGEAETEGSLGLTEQSVEPNL